MADSDPQPTRREPLAFEAVDGDTGRLVPVQLSYDKLRSLKTAGAGRLYEARDVVREALRAPVAIFEGLTRDADEDRRGVGWRCYVARPGIAYDADGRPTKPLPHTVFLVFVNHENVAYNWRWE